MTVSKQMIRAIAPMIFVAAAPLAANASPITLIDLAGALDKSAPTGPVQTYNGIATTFFLGSDVSAATLSLDVLCVTGPCSGQFFLTGGDVSAGSPSLLDVENVAAFDVSADFGGAAAVGFSGLELSAGTYSLQMTFETGLGGWLGSIDPVVTSVLGFGVGDAISYKADNPVLPFFSTSQPVGYTPHFELTGSVEVQPPAVPLPASAFLLLGGLGLLWRIRAA